MMNISGVDGAEPIWHDFMEQSLEDAPEMEFEKPDGIREVEICELSGKLPTVHCKNRIYEIPLFLCVTLNLMRPDLIASWIGIPHEQRYWTYLIGLALYGFLYLMQRLRAPKEVAAGFTA